MLREKLTNIVNVFYLLVVNNRIQLKRYLQLIVEGGVDTCSMLVWIFVMVSTLAKK